MSLGDITKAINAQNVLLKMGSPLEEFVTLYRVRFSDESVLERRNTRSGPLDTPTFRIVEITGDATVSKDVYDKLRSMRVATARGALPSEPMSVEGQAITSAIDDTGTTGVGTLRRLEFIGEERGRYELNMTFRIKNGTIVN